MRVPLGRLFSFFTSTRPAVRRTAGLDVYWEVLRIRRLGTGVYASSQDLGPGEASWPLYTLFRKVSGLGGLVAFLYFILRPVGLVGLNEPVLRTGGLVYWERVLEDPFPHGNVNGSSRNR